MGAVIGKQWLANYERTGQTGSLQSQSLLRTEKFLGAQAWSLEGVIETLPSALLVSFALFFWGMIDYMFLTNFDVGLVVAVLVSIAAVPYTFSVLAAAIVPRCPFKTSVSETVRHVGLWLVAILAWTVRTTVGDLDTTLEKTTKPSGWVRVLAVTVAKLGDEKVDLDEEALRKDTLYAYSVALMLELATEDRDVLSLAENIPTLLRRDSVRVLARDATFSLLLAQYAKSMFRLAREEVGAAAHAVPIARAVAHVFAAEPERCHQAIWESISHITCPTGEDFHEASLLFTSILDLCKRFKFDQSPYGGQIEETTPAEGDEDDRPQEDEKMDRTSLVDPATTTLLAPLLALSASLHAFLPILDDSMAVFSMASIALCQHLQADPSQPARLIVKDVIEDIWLPRDEYALQCFVA